MRKEYQAEPHVSLKDRTNFLEILKGVSTIYVYPHHEINLVDGKFQQTRSGPNWEGGHVTMTTCKHLLRTYNSIESGKTAIVGLTNKLEGDNFVMYVGVIDKTFDSNYDLGLYLKDHHPEAYKIKLAKHNRLGDIFEPFSDTLPEDKYDLFSFDDPIHTHCRAEENDSKGNPKWWKDIQYVTRNGTRPKCLILNPVTVHTSPMFSWKGKLGRSGVVFKGDNCISEFMSNLEEEL